MLGRAAACAAILFVWPVCTQICAGDGPRPVAEIVTTDQEQTDVAERNTEVEEQSALLHSADVAAATEPLRRAQTNADLASQTAPAIAAEPFGLDAEPVVTGAILVKWSGIEAQISAENRVLAQCRNGGAWCPRAARRFLAIVDRGRARNGRARIGVINRDINLSIVPTTDFAQWGVADRWSPPLETFTTLRGDCEDYAIAKYVALRAAGIPQQDIRLIVVRNNAASEHHAVVAVRLNGDWLILDNRWLALVRDHEMWRATPLFELDDNGVRRFVDPAARKDQASSGSS